MPKSHFDFTGATPTINAVNAYAEPVNCNTEMAFYDDCQLWTLDARKYLQDFPDLIRLCKKREWRNHFTKKARDPVHTKKCQSITYASDEPNAKCGWTDSNTTFTYCPDGVHRYCEFSFSNCRDTGGASCEGKCIAKVPTPLAKHNTHFSFDTKVYFENGAFDYKAQLQGVLSDYVHLPAFEENGLDCGTSRVNAIRDSMTSTP
jgi:hypothetical protein